LTDIPTEISERFDIHGLFADGRTGTLHHATERTTGRKGLLKLLRPESLGSASDRQRIKRELTKQVTLSHATLALPWACGEAGKTLWLFREHLAGRTLAQRVAQDGPITASEAFAVIAQLAEGLDELHRAGLLFRDLTPQHVVLKDDGSVIAFGAGIAPPIDHEEVFELFGTPEYVSPEQTAGKLVSFRSDLYALGCLFHTLVGGKPPFTGATKDVLAAHASTPAPSVSNVAPEAASLIEQLLAKDPKQRPFSAQQVRRGLDPFLPDLLKSGEMAMPAARKATLLGMPAVSPPRPPSLEPPRPPSMEPPKPPSMEAPKAAPKRNPDATQQVAIDDILEEGAIAKAAKVSAPPPPPPSAPRMSSAPPPPPSAAKKADTTQQLDALDLEEEVAPAPVIAAAAVVAAVAAPVATAAETTGGFEVLSDPSEVSGDDADDEDDVRANAPDVAPAVASPAPAMDDLDYDDLAETMAREAPSALAPMAPHVDTSAQHIEPQPQSPQPSAQPASVQVAPARTRRDTTPVLPEDRVSHTPTMTAVTEPPNRNGLYALAGGALVFLSVLLFIGYQAFKPEPVATVVQMPAPTPVGDAPTASPPVATPTPAVAPLEVAEPTVEPTVEPVVEAAVEPATEATEPVAEETAEEPTVEPTEAAEEAEEAAPAEETEPRPGRRGRRERAARPARAASPFDQAREAAREAFQARNFAAAEQAYVRATSINPRHAGSWAGLGAARMQTRNFAGAVQAYQRAVQLQSNNSGYFTMLGHAFRMSGNTAGARQAYQRALAIDPANAAAQQGLNGG
jgi:serine/threonine-protein kinase